MFRNLRVDPEQKKLVNLPAGWIVLFLAKIKDMHPFLYAAIIGPKETCLPAEQDHFRELGGEAKLILFTVENPQTHNVSHGHKYAQGGGMIEIDKGNRGATWTTSDECGRNEVFGVRVKPEDVLVAL